MIVVVVWLVLMTMMRYDSHLLIAEGGGGDGDLFSSLSLGTHCSNSSICSFDSLTLMSNDMIDIGLGVAVIDVFIGDGSFRACVSLSR
jgi:hypothetical protein